MFVALKCLMRSLGLSLAGWVRVRTDRGMQPIETAALWLVLAAALVAGGPRGDTGEFHATGQMPAKAGLEAGDPIAAKAGSWVPTQDSWNEQLNNPNFWANRKSGGKSSSSGSFGKSNWPAPSGLTNAQPKFTPPLPSQASFPLQKRSTKSSASRDDDDDDDKDDRWSKSGNTYRTVCVRLCDGFFYPVSFATTRDNFDRDASACERTCGGPSDARLFTYRNPGGDIEDMEDLDGKPYKKLQTAFLFRTKYDAQCKCRAHPWEDASQTRHKSYALAAAAQKGDSSAARELGALKTKMLDEARAAAKDKQAQAKAKREAALQEKAAADAAEAASRAERKARKAAGLSDRRAALAMPGTGRAKSDPSELAEPGRSDAEPGTLRQVQTRAGAIPDPAAAPAGGRTSIVIMRYGSRSPVEVSVPSARQSLTPIPSRRDADAGQKSRQP
jgi:Protein of unknown function (DUF2865)